MSFDGFEYEDYSTPLDIVAIKAVIITLYSIVFFMCITGNLLLLVVIIVDKRLRTVTNFFLANLAFTGLCVGVFCVLPNLATNLVPYWYLGRVMCKASYFVQAMSYTASISTLVVISIERYVAIIYPMHSRRLQTMFLLKTTLIGVWSIAAFSGAPYLFIYDTKIIDSNFPYFGIEYEDNNSTFTAAPNGTLLNDSFVHTFDDGSCSQMPFCVPAGSHPFNETAITTSWFVVCYVLPLGLMAVVYTKISIVLWRSSGANTADVIVGSRKFQTAVINVAVACSQIDADNSTQSAVGYQESKFPITGVVYRTYESRENVDNADVTALPGTIPDKPVMLDSPARKTAVGADPVANLQRKKSKMREEQRHQLDNVDHLEPRESSNEAAKWLRVNTEPRHKISESHGDVALKARRKVIRLLIVLVVSFALCVLPYHVRKLWLVFGEPSVDYWQKLVPPLTIIIYYTNSALNPLLYAFLSNKFRSRLVELLTTRCHPRCPGRTSSRRRNCGMLRDDELTRRSSRLPTKTTFSLRNLNTKTTFSLRNLNTKTTFSLRTLNTKTTFSLRTLNTKTTFSLRTLNTKTTYSLRTLNTVSV